jgi:hypothetical protein
LNRRGQAEGSGRRIKRETNGQGDEAVSAQVVRIRPGGGVGWPPRLCGDLAYVLAVSGDGVAARRVRPVLAGPAGRPVQSPAVTQLPQRAEPATDTRPHSR